MNEPTPNSLDFWSDFWGAYQFGSFCYLKLQQYDVKKMFTAYNIKRYYKFSDSY